MILLYKLISQLVSFTIKNLLLKLTLKRGTQQNRKFLLEFYIEERQTHEEQLELI